FCLSCGDTSSPFPDGVRELAEDPPTVRSRESRGAIVLVRVVTRADEKQAGYFIYLSLFDYKNALLGGIDAVLSASDTRPPQNNEIHRLLFPNFSNHLRFRAPYLPVCWMR